MALADFSAGVQGSLEDMVKRRMLEEAQAAQFQKMQADQQARTRGLDLQGRGLDQNAERIGLERQRFDYGVNQDTKAAEAEAAASAGLDQFGQTLPEWMRPVVQGKKFGLSLKPEDLTQAPETREQASARELTDFQKKNAITTSGAIRVAGATRQPREDKRVWVTRGGQPVFIGESQIQPGDAPYQKGGEQNSGPSQYAIDTANRTIAAVDDVLSKVTNATAGVGSVLRNIPGTKAANVSADLSAVAANVAFTTLQNMREASKTGGALGQISERELDLLSAVEGSIRQDQSPANLRINLIKIKESQQRWLAEAIRLGAVPAVGGAAQPQGGAAADPLGIR